VVEHRHARDWQFDPAENNFTLLTLILSLQASYAAPLILLAQNRQDDRDRVQIEQDRQRAERNLADTEYLAREIVALRMALGRLRAGRHPRRAARRAPGDAERAARRGSGGADSVTTDLAAAVRRAVGAVTDPELRRPLAELDMIRDVGRRGRRPSDRADDRGLSRRRPHRGRCARRGSGAGIEGVEVVVGVMTPDERRADRSPARRQGPRQMPFGPTRSRA
jgi:hypothetical protein